MTDLKSSERCVLCLDQKRSPVRIQCGHSFCFDCLDVYKSYQKYAWANKCPICRSLLKEKKRAVKRKYSTENMVNGNAFNMTETSQNSNPTSTITSPPIENQTESIEQTFLLEEFIAWATEYTSGESQDYNSDQYEEQYNHDRNEDDEESESTEEEETEDVAEFDNDDDDNRNNGTVANFSTDSEDEDDYYYDFNNNFAAVYYQPVDNVENNAAIQNQTQQQQQYLFTDCNNNITNMNFIDPNTDWDEAIANEVIIID